MLVTTKRYSKLARAIPTSKTTPTYVAKLFFDNLPVPYFNSASLLIDKNVHFTGKFSATLCTMLGVNYFITTK